MLPLPRRAGAILKIQPHVRRTKILTDPLKILFATILQLADKASANVLLLIGKFYGRLNELDDALEVYNAALRKVENQEVLVKYILLSEMGSILNQQGR